MHSDKQFYQIFEANPEWLFELTGRASPGPCKFVSITIKAIERRSDGLLLPDRTDQPITIAEIQMQADSEVFQRVVIEMAMMQTEYPGRQIEGFILFASRFLDPLTEPWAKVVESYYLDELLDKLLERVPKHPLIAVFQPLMQADRAILERDAASYYNQIHETIADERQRERLQGVFLDWLMQRFSERGKEEIEQMLIGQLPGLRETQAAKDLIAIGILEGREEGREEGILIGKIQLLEDILGLKSTTIDEFDKLGIEELHRRLDILRDQLRNR